MSLQVDLLIKQALVLPMAGADPIPSGEVAVADGRIAAVGTELDVDATETVNAAGRMLLPGLVDAHTHVALTSVRGRADREGHPVYDVMWSVETALTPDLCRDLARLGIADGLLSGVTTIADHYFFMEAIAHAVDDLGIRGVLGHTVMTAEGPWVGEAQLTEAVAFAERWDGRHPRIVPALAPHAPDTVADAWLVELAEVARQRSLVVHIHLAQSQREVDVVHHRTGRSPVVHLDELGLLDGPMLAAHCTYVTDEDLDRLVAHPPVTPVYCPTVHALDGRVLRAAELVDRGARVAIGTDAPPTERVSVLAEARAAVTGQGILTGQRRALPPEAALELSTSVGAAAVGLGDTVGRIAVGSQADLVLLHSDTVRTTPMPDPFTAAVMATGDADVDQVYVGGRRVVDGGRLLTADQSEIVATGRAAAEELFRRAAVA